MVAQAENMRRMEAATTARQVITGMTEDQVVRMWGQPQAVKREESPRSGWIWAYEDGFGRKLVYLDKGIVTDVQSIQPSAGAANLYNSAKAATQAQERLREAQRQTGTLPKSR
jgi:hypothetical protein